MTVTVTFMARGEAVMVAVRDVVVGMGARLGRPAEKVIWKYRLVPERPRRLMTTELASAEAAYNKARCSQDPCPKTYFEFASLCVAQPGVESRRRGIAVFEGTC